MLTRVCGLTFLPATPENPKNSHAPLSPRLFAPSDHQAFTLLEPACFQAFFLSYCLLPAFQSQVAGQALAPRAAETKGTGTAPSRTSHQARLWRSPELTSGLPVGGRKKEGSGERNLTLLPPPCGWQAAILGWTVSTPRARPTFGSKAPRHQGQSGTAEPAMAAEEAQVPGFCLSGSAQRARLRVVGDQKQQSCRCVGGVRGHGPEPALGARAGRNTGSCGAV